MVPGVVLEQVEAVGKPLLDQGQEIYCSNSRAGMRGRGGREGGEKGERGERGEKAVAQNAFL